MLKRGQLLYLCGLFVTVFTEECTIEMEENLVRGTNLSKNILQCLNIDASKFQGYIQSQNQINNGAQYLSNSFLNLSSTGDIRIAKVVDRDTLCSSNQAICRMKHSVIIYDSQTDTTYDLILQIYVKDQNDNVPRFKIHQAMLQIIENTIQSQAMLLPAAYDSDSLENITYKLLPLSNHFALFNSSASLASGLEPQLLQLQALDFEKTQQLSFTLLACDSANQCSAAPLNLLIKVEDQNDNAPVFLPPYVSPTLPVPNNVDHDMAAFPTLSKLENGQYKYVTSVREDESGILLRIRVQDADSEPNSRVKFTLESLTTENVVENDFAINPLSYQKGITEGELVIKNTLIPNSDHVPYVFNIRATDSGAPTMQTIAIVEIIVLDINNHKPEIAWKPFFKEKGLKLKENIPNRKIALISVVDKDLGDNGKVQCNIGSNDQSAQFNLKNISSANYMLNNDHIYDCERLNNTRVEIVCRDFGKPSMTSSIMLSIPVIDVNEWPPVFTKKLFNSDIDEDDSEYVARLVLRVHADDKDCTTQLSYAIINDDGNYFRIDAKNGAIYTARNIDREQMLPQLSSHNVIEFGVRVSDGQFHDIATVRITINDINDNAPSIENSLPIKVKENEVIGKEIGKIDAHDNDQVGHPNSQVHFSLMFDTMETAGSSLDANEMPFEVTSDGHIKLRKALDREMKAHYLLHVKAVDGSMNGVRHTSSGSVSILIEDVNDNKPYFQQPPRPDTSVLLYDSVKLGSLVYTLVANDMDEIDQRHLTYQILPEITQSFTVNRTTGEITVKRLLMPGQIHLLIRASDGLFFTDSSLNLNITKDTRRLVDGVEQNQTFELNFTLVVIMVAVTSSICVTLVVIIVLLYRQQCCRCFNPHRHWQQGNVVSKERGSTIMDAMYSAVDAHVTDDSIGALTTTTTFGQIKSCDSQLVVDSCPSFVVRRSESPLQKVVHQPGTRRNPYDLEVASADSGHEEAREEDTLSELKSNASTFYHRYHTLPHRALGEISQGQNSNRAQPPAYNTLNRTSVQPACSCTTTPSFTDDLLHLSATHGVRGFNRTTHQRSPLAISDSETAYYRSSPASLTRPQFTTTRINITPNVTSSSRSSSNNGCVTPLHWA